LMAYGVRRWTGDRNDFAAVLRGRPTVRIDLDSPSPFARLLISVPDAVKAGRKLGHSRRSKSRPLGGWGAGGVLCSEP
jgi:hypothetical protein